VVLDVHQRRKNNKELIKLRLALAGGQKQCSRRDVRNWNQKEAKKRAALNERSDEEVRAGIGGTGWTD
jgi:hypothetical protein